MFRGEILTVNVTEDSQFTDLTFSMLEDTGWYMTGSFSRLPQSAFSSKSGNDEMMIVLESGEGTILNSCFNRKILVKNVTRFPSQENRGKPNFLGN